jgi:uncharacterized protein YhdP
VIGRGTRIALEVIAGVTVGLIVLFASAAIRLTQGPVSLALLKPYVIETIGHDTSLGIDFDDLVLAWAGWERNLDVRAVGVHVRSGDGDDTASIPEMSISFSLPALAEGRLAPTSLDFIKPKLRIVRDKDGAVRLGVGEAGAKDERMPLIGDRFLALSEDGTTAHLRRISVVDGEVLIEDRSLGVTWRAPKANLMLRRGTAGLDLRFALDVAVDEQLAKFAGAATYVPGQPTFKVNATVDGLAVKSVALGAEFEPLSKWDLRLNASFNGEVGQDGSIRTLRAEIKSGPGKIVLPAPVNETVEVRAVEAKGSYDDSKRQVQIDGLKFDIDGATLGLAGQLVRVGRDATLDGTITGNAIPTALIWRLWPKEVAASTRRWVSTNLEGGVVNDVSAHVFARLDGRPNRPPTLETATGTLRLRGVDVHYLRPLPPATKVEATLAFTPSRVDISIRSGELGRLQIPEGTLAFTNLDRSDYTLDLEMVVNGPVSDALEVLDNPRLGYIKQFGVAPKDVAGVMATRLIVQLPLIDALKFDRVAIRAASNLRDVAAPRVAFGQSLTGGTMVLKLDKTSMSVSGQAKLLGADADLSWTEDFSGRAQYRRRVEARGTVDAASLASMGWDLGGTVRGPMELDVVYAVPDSDRYDLAVRAKLDQAAISVPQLVWTKPAGRPGEASVDMVHRENRGWTVRKFNVQAEAFSARGSAAFGAEGNRLERLDIEELLQPPRIRLSATARRTEDSVLDVAIKAAGYDAQPLFEDIDDDTRPGTPLPPMRVKFDADSLWLAGDTPLRRTSGVLNYDGKAWNRIDIRGRVGDGKPFSFDLTRAEAGTVASLKSEDAGATLSGFGIVDDIKGGKLEFEAKRAPAAAAPWQGRVELQDFRLEKAPQIARVLTLTSLTGISDVLTGKGIHFRVLEFPYVHENRRVTFNDARAVGSELGVTASGWIGLKSRELDIKGTLVPAYTLNSLLGNIPVIGQLFTGAKGSGVFAVSYGVTGPLKDPKATANPVSAFAPGFLRNLIDGLVSPGAALPDHSPTPNAPVSP